MFIGTKLFDAKCTPLVCLLSFASLLRFGVKGRPAVSKAQRYQIQHSRVSNKKHANTKNQSAFKTQRVIYFLGGSRIKHDIPMCQLNRVHDMMR